MDHEETTARQVFSLPRIRHEVVPTAADQVFSVLQQRILTLELPPNTRISESEVARQMGVSRQPVREAFRRLARLDFLVIRPQTVTKVSLISESAVLRARFIRTALEVHATRLACEVVDSAGHKLLASILEQQKDAIADADRDLFHALDEEFHRQICTLAGVGYVWDIIHDNKAQMDRVRMLSLNLTSQQQAFDEHVAVFDAISARDADAAAEATSDHLSRILFLIKQLKEENHRWFSDVEVGG